MYQGACKEHAEAEIFSALLPAFPKRLRYVYLDHLKMMVSRYSNGSTKRDENKGKFMEKEDFEVAAEAAILTL